MKLPRGGTMDAVRETGSARVHQVLREEILRMTLRPGTTLDETSLSERFKLSRSPIREALIKLAGEGLATILPNRTTIVTPIDFLAMPRFLDALDLLQRVTTRLAALLRDDRDIAAIRQAQKAYERSAARSISARDSVPMIEANHAFHMAVARACKNAYYIGFYRRLLDEGRRMLHLHFEFQAANPDLKVEDLAADHTTMVEAIERRDADEAESIAHRHATMFRGRFMRYMDQNLTADMRVD
jgi:DNA-binding GntR family transcriptional regulator